jgi:hypothetical protein
MGNLAIKPKLTTLFHQYGEVTQLGETVTVHSDSTVYQAKRAASCLLEPMLGDKVLMVTDTEGADYVLAVLERSGEGRAVMHLPGDAEIRTDTGSLRISGRDGIRIQTPGEMTLQSSTLAVQALQGDVTIQSLSLVGDAWRSCIDRVKTVGRSFDSILERCHQRVSRSYRIVEEMDQVKAGQIDYTADTSLQLHAKYALVTAEDLVKMDADQIHLG